MSSISAVSSSPIYGPAYPAPSTAASTAASTPAAGKGHKSKSKSNADFLSQLEQAVTNALQSAKQSDATDPNDAVKTAIEQIFSQNSLPQDTTPEAEASNLTSETGGTADAAHTAFLRALKANGIDPEQFTTDFLAAAKEAKNGAGGSMASVASALKNLPAGSLLDVAA